MVVFTCSHCGESLQKPRVEKHYSFVCRRPKSLTCVDCLRDFRNEDYVAHTKCITEEERYAAKGSIINGVVKKGEVKQESWVDMVRSIIEKDTNIKASHRNLLNSISGYSNIPRKKIKFINFIKSSSGGRANQSDVEAVWDIIEKYKTEQVNFKDISNTKPDSKHEKSENNEKRQLLVDDTVANKKKRQKVTESDNYVNVESNKFDFQSKIIQILNSKGSISIKKLQKKVLNRYMRETGETECTSKIIKKFNKRIKKMANIQIEDDTVTLVFNEET